MSSSCFCYDRGSSNDGGGKSDKRMDMPAQEAVGRLCFCSPLIWDQFCGFADSASGLRLARGCRPLISAV